jgi:hypothetical protein
MTARKKGDESVIARHAHTGSGKLLRTDTADTVAEVKYWLSIEEDREGVALWGGQLWTTGPSAEALRDSGADEFQLVMEDGRSGRLKLGRSAGSLGGSALGAFFTGVGAPPV